MRGSFLIDTHASSWPSLNWTVIDDIEPSSGEIVDRAVERVERHVVRVRPVLESEIDRRNLGGETGQHVAKFASMLVTRGEPGKESFERVDCQLPARRVDLDGVQVPALVGF